MTAGTSRADVAPARPGPVVEPGEPLTTEELRRYGRHLLVPEVGEVGQRRLKAAKVLVVGAGGLGSPVLTYLAAAGIGTIGIVDADVVEESNLQRQVVHGVADVGRPKVDSARDTLAEVNPLVQVVTHQVRLDSTNALEVLAPYDVVVDGTDNFPTRYLVGDACVLLGKPCVWGSVYRFDGQASTFWAGHGPCYRCVFPEPPPPGMVPSCAEGGVLGVLCAAVGAVQAAEVVRLVTGVGDLLTGRLLVHDALHGSWRELRVRRDPSCAVCGDEPTVRELVDYEGFCGVPSVADVPSVSATELAELLARRDQGDWDGVLVDVREANERAIAVIDGAVAVPKGEFESGEALGRVPFDRPVVLYCRSGVRSAACLEVLRAAGHPDVRHLDGGILAWARDVDPSLPAT